MRAAQILPARLLLGHIWTLLRSLFLLSGLASSTAAERRVKMSKISWKMGGKWPGNTGLRAALVLDRIGRRV